MKDPKLINASSVKQVTFIYKELNACQVSLDMTEKMMIHTSTQPSKFYLNQYMNLHECSSIIVFIKQVEDRDKKRCLQFILSLFHNENFSINKTRHVGMYFTHGNKLLGNHIFGVRNSRFHPIYTDDVMTAIT